MTEFNPYEDEIPKLSPIFYDEKTKQHYGYSLSGKRINVVVKAETPENIPINITTFKPKSQQEELVEQWNKDVGNPFDDLKSMSDKWLHDEP